MKKTHVSGMQEITVAYTIFYDAYASIASSATKITELPDEYMGAISVMDEEGTVFEDGPIWEACIDRLDFDKVEAELLLKDKRKLRRTGNHD